MEKNDILYDMERFICYVENNYGEFFEITLDQEEYKTLSYFYKQIDFTLSKYSTELRKYPISNKKWYDFIQALYEIRLVEWNNEYDGEEKYINNNSSWSIVIGSTVGRTIAKCGEGVYHPSWQQFIRALENLIDKSIEMEMVNHLN